MNIKEHFKVYFLLASTAVLAILLVLMARLVQGSTNSIQPVHIFGATYMTRNNPYFDVLQEGIEEVVEGNGDILISRDPNQDQDKQNEQIMEMIDEGIEVLFLNPVDKEKVLPALQACQEAGVTVINVDTVVENTEYVTAIIETDNYQAGVLCAQDMMERIDSGKIVILDNPIQNSITNRVQGFMDTIEGNDDFEVVYEDISEGEFEVAADIMADCLEQNIEFNVILGGNDPTALGARAALQQYHVGDDVLIYGIDGSPDFKAMLELGYVTATSAQSPATLGRVAAEMAYDYLNGEEIPAYTSIEPYLIKKENLSEYEIDVWQ